MGPSGSGKTSLLNVLSGFKRSNVTGNIEIDDVKKSYIMQLENLHTEFTVQESMMFSANVRSGFGISRGKKESKVNEVLESLGLKEKKKSLVKFLSGGELKRLSIAQELIDNPAVMFIDEPTTGLDSASATVCINLLKDLAVKGRTIVCTIHTPSGLLLKQFDHLYALASGRCIYQGSSSNLVPFLLEVGLNCSTSYNPCDFLIEIANGEYGEHIEELSEKIFNGQNQNFRLKKNSMEKFRPSPSKHPKVYSNYLEQVWFLIIRYATITFRDKTNMLLRILVHIVCGILVALFFIDVGEEASKILSNFKMVHGSTTFIFFTGFYSMVTRFTLEKPIIKREYFNKWYSTSAYYTALTLVDIPLVIICTTLYVIIIYRITGQPPDGMRFTGLLMSQFCTNFIAQGLGLMIGSFFSLMVRNFDCIKFM